MNKEPIYQMKEQLELCSDAVIKNTTLVTPGDLKQNYLLHVAMKKQTSLTPCVSKSAAYSEDNSIVRVHSAPTLAGCIIGFSLSKYYLENSVPSKSTKVSENNFGNTNYLGGLYIHKIPFEVALRPNSKLVFDANQTDEHWLITYSSETRQYPVIVIGKIIFSQLIVTPRLGKRPSNTNIYLIEIDDNEGIYLDKDNLLTTGYWEVNIDNEVGVTKVVKTTKPIFDENHKLKASLLNYSEVLPFTNW